MKNHFFGRQSGRTALAFLAFAAASLGVASPISLTYGRFDPLVSVPNVPADLQADAPVPGVGQTMLLQLRSSQTEADRTYLAGLGVAIRGFVPTNALIVEATPAQVAQLRAWDRTRWTGPVHAAYKFSRDFGTTPLFSPNRLIERAAGQIRVSAMLWEGATTADAVSTAQSLGMANLGVHRLGERWVVHLRGDRLQANQIARLDDVSYVEEIGEPVRRNSITSWVIQSNQNGVRPVTTRGIRGQGIIIGVVDGQIDMNHNMFRDPANNTVRPEHRKVVFYASQAGLGADGHGTHVAGTVAGDREPTSGTSQENGHADKARIAFQDFTESAGAQFYDQLLAMYNVGARDFCNSWGMFTNQYNALAVAIDRFSWDREEGMVAFATSNGPLLENPENAKNTLAVAATRQAPNQNQLGSGGLGPTIDGRRKPEVMAPGIGIVSAAAGSPNGVMALSGTSMACPSVTAAAALIRQYYRDGWLDDGLQGGDGITASGALIRASLKASAVDATGIAGWPSTGEGWGRIVLDNFMYFQGDSRRTFAWDVRNANGLLQGEQREFTVNVNSSSEPLRIVMTFTDFPAEPLAINAAVNNVDLTVIGPDATVYRGNNIVNSNSVAGGAADAINSTEVVNFTAPQPGQYTIRVTVPNINRGTRQGFAVVATGSAATIPPATLNAAEWELTHGNLLGGVLASLNAVDGDRIRIRTEPFQRLGHAATMRVRFNTETPANQIASLTLRMNTAISTTQSATGTLWLRNWQTGQMVSVRQFPVRNPGQPVTFNVPRPFNRWISPTGDIEMMLRAHRPTRQGTGFEFLVDRIDIVQSR